MKVSTIVFALVAAAAAATTLTAASGFVDETEHISRTAKLEPGGTLRLRNFAGRVTITGGDRRDAAIDAVRRATRDRLDYIKLDIHNEGATLVIDANHRISSWRDWWGNNNVVPTDLDVKVPRKTNLDVHVFSSPVTVEGVEGDHRLHGFSSRFQLEGVAGSVQAHTFSGAVEIGEKSWQPRQTIDIDTFSGSVALNVPEQAKASLSFHTFSGQLNSDMPLVLNGVSTRRRGSFTARLGPDDADAGIVRVKTFSGSLRIRR